MASNNNIIEFMGLPCSGKSTLAPKLLNFLQGGAIKWQSTLDASILAIRRRNDGILSNFIKHFPYPVWESLSSTRHAFAEFNAFAADHTEFFERLFHVLNSCGIRDSWKQCVLYAMLKRSAERQLFMDRLDANEGVVIEEGLVYGAQTLYNLVPPDGWAVSDLEHYVKSIPSPTAIIWLDVEEKDCAIRLAKRSELPLLWTECSDAQLMTKIKQGRRCLREIAQAYEKIGIPVYCIKNDQGNLEESIRTIKLMASELCILHNKSSQNSD
jgi:thymidylate kinase